MSRRPRVQQKQILRLDSTLSLPPSRVDSPEALIALIQSLHRSGHLIIGISSVGRAMVRGEVALLLFASDINPPELIEHLLQMAVQGKVPVVATGLGAAAIGKKISLRSTAVLGVRGAAAAEIELLRPFVADISPPLLPFLRVETDCYGPSERTTDNS